MTKYRYRMPTPDELYALEHEARRLRAQAMSEAFAKGVSKVRSLLARAASATATKVVRHA